MSPSSGSENYTITVCLCYRLCSVVTDFLLLWASDTLFGCFLVFFGGFFYVFFPQHYSHSLLLTLSLPLRQTNHSYLTWNASSMQVHWHGNGATDTIFQTNVPGADHLNQFCLTSFGQQLDCNRCLFPYKSWNSHLKQRYLIWLFVSVLICIISASILMTVPLINVFIF